MFKTIYTLVHIETRAKQRTMNKIFTLIVTAIHPSSCVQLLKMMTGLLFSAYLKCPCRVLDKQTENALRHKAAEVSRLHLDEFLFRNADKLR